MTHWRQYLTPEEAEEVARIDAETRVIRGKSHSLATMLQTHRARAGMRRAYLKRKSVDTLPEHP